MNAMHDQKTSNEEVQTALTSFARAVRHRNLREIEVILFGFLLVLGNRGITWNRALALGSDAYFFNIIFVGTGFICLCLCMGEMSSALPFSGGIFGFVRATVGNFTAYVTALFEIAFNLPYTVIKTHQLINLFVDLNLMEEGFRPYATTIFYISALSLNIIGGKPFWLVVVLLGTVPCVLYLIYLGGAADASVWHKALNYNEYCHSDTSMTIEHFFAGRTFINGHYQGLHLIPLLSDSLKNPREQIPRVMIICSLTFMLMSLFISLAACSQSPGIEVLKSLPYPLQHGFAYVFNISLDNAKWFNLPGSLGVAFGLSFCVGRQIYTISKSGLILNAFTATTPKLETPYLSHLFTAALGIGLNLLVFYYPIAYDEVRNVSVLATHIVYFNAFIAYFFFKYKYSTLPRSFTSPLGIWGAIYGCCNYFIGMIGIIFYAKHTYDSIYALCVLFALGWFWYYFYLVKFQSFSDEEKKLMFQAYLINANREKRNRLFLKKNNKVGIATSSNNKSGSALTKGLISASTNHSSIHETRDTVDRPNDDIPQVHSQSDKASIVSTVSAGHVTREAERASRSQVSRSSAISIRASTSFSNKLSEFISGKINAVFPLAIDAAESTAEREFMQMMVLSGGGVLDREEEVALKEKFGVDIEASANLNQNENP